jgi:predicted RNA binding protein YcfA (HicA-like mRNA interferase family)
MKRRDLIQHLVKHGCSLHREGANHTIYANPKTNATSAVPRHNEVNDFLARRICRDLQVPDP